MTSQKSLTALLSSSLLTSSLLATSFLGITISLGQFTQLFHFSNVQRLVGVLTTEQTGLSSWHQQDDLELAENLLSASVKAEQLAVINHRAAFAHARASLLMATKTDNLDSKAQLICNARTSFIHAAQLAPAVVEYQIAWADLDAQLHRPRQYCETISKNGTATESQQTDVSPTARLEFALRGAPYDGRNQYLAALVFLALGDKSRALDLMRHNQEFNPYFADPQREFLSRLIWTENDLRHAMPRKFPEVIRWVERYRQDRNDDYRRWTPSLVEAVSASIDELLARLDSNPEMANSVRSYLTDIAQLPLSNASDSLGRRLDRVLSRFYTMGGLQSAESQWGSVLAERANLHRVSVAKSLIVDDRNPRSTSLFAWSSDDDTRTGALDMVGRSLGVMIPEDTHPKIIIIESSATGARIAPDDLEIWQSNDNSHFSLVDNRPSIKNITLGGQQRLVIDVTNLHERFLKFRFMGSSQQARFSNTLQQLVQVYSSEMPAEISPTTIESRGRI